MICDYISQVFLSYATVTISKSHWLTKAIVSFSSVLRVGGSRPAAAVSTARLAFISKIQSEEAAPSWDMKFLWQRENTRWLACIQLHLCYIQSHPTAKVSHIDQVQRQYGGVCVSPPLEAP